MYGINSELYRENNILFGKVYFSLFMIPIVFDNFMHTKFLGLVHDIFESDIKPRKLKVHTCAISLLLIDNAIGTWDHILIGMKNHVFCFISI